MNSVSDMGTDSAQERIRAFMCVELPRAVVAAIALQAKSLAVLGMSPVREANMHITLAFLGYVKASSVPYIEHVMSCIERAPFKISIGAPSTFGSGSPRVIFLGVEDGATELSELRSKLYAGLERLGIHDEPRPFVPHLTLARVHGLLSDDASARTHSALAGGRYEFICNGISLMQSILGEGAPVHKELFFRPFPGLAPSGTGPS